VPDQWGQPATGGTKFLGTPDNYLELLKQRPVSPDLFGVEGASRGGRRQRQRGGVRVRERPREAHGARARAASRAALCARLPCGCTSRSCARWRSGLWRRCGQAARAGEQRTTQTLSGRCGCCAAAGGAHYKFPPVALSSITTRITGCVLSGGARARGWAARTRSQP
jgi:hypothetical protein